MVATVLAAYPQTQKRLKGRNFILMLMLITMYFSGSLIPDYILVKNHHLLNNVWRLILSGLMSVYNMIILKSLFQSMPDSLEEAAALDGCNELMILFRMTKDRQKTVDRIEEYLCNNDRKDIGINDISDYLGLSYSYVRKIFKSEKGANIVDYLNSIRIREAKNLLLCKNLSIKSIATSIGYNNNQSFGRYFKKFVDVMPADYRIKMLAETTGKKQ